MFRLIFAFLLLARSVAAEPPVVVTDIAPVHGLVSRVMEGIGSPELLLPPGVSPHGYALRPSQAQALQKADLLVWVGPELTPWLEKPLATLAGQARGLELLDTMPELLLSYAEHDDHDEGDDHDGHDEDHGHEGHDEGDDHDNHDEGDDHDGHDHSGADPHAWLDPQVAGRWVGVIAKALTAADPDNAARYEENAAQARAELQALEADMNSALATVRHVPFVTFHDAYRYLQHRFDLNNVGTLRTGDATAPGAARVAALRAQIAESGAVCAFAEPQFDPSLLRAAGEHGDIRIATLDPMGAGLSPGPEFYPALMQSLVTALTDCLGSS